MNRGRATAELLYAAPEGEARKQLCDYLDKLDEQAFCYFWANHQPAPQPGIKFEYFPHQKLTP